jgi:hypothetical protein
VKRATRRAKLAVEKRRNRGKGEGGVRVYVRSAAGRGGGCAGKEGTLLLLLVVATVAIAANSVGRSRDDPTTPAASSASLSWPT